MMVWESGTPFYLENHPLIEKYSINLIMILKFQIFLIRWICLRVRRIDSTFSVSQELWDWSSLVQAILVIGKKLNVWTMTCISTFLWCKESRVCYKMAMKLFCLIRKVIMRYLFRRWNLETIFRLNFRFWLNCYCKERSKLLILKKVIF
jgi:hypothetical protein